MGLCESKGKVYNNDFIYVGLGIVHIEYLLGTDWQTVQTNTDRLLESVILHLVFGVWGRRSSAKDG